MEIFNLVQIMAGICDKTVPVWKLLGNILNVLQIGIPIIIVLLATLDLGKAVMAGEDKKIKDAQKMLLMRLAYGVAIFFVTMIVKVVFGLIGQNVGDDDSAKCWTCLSNPNAGGCTNSLIGGTD